MDLKRKKKLLGGTVWLLYLPVILGWILRTVWVMLLSVPLVLVWAVLVVVHWRCPACGTRLPRPDMKFKCCPQCGKDLGLEGDA